MLLGWSHRTILEIINSEIYAISEGFSRLSLFRDSQILIVTACYTLHFTPSHKVYALLIGYNRSTQGSLVQSSPHHCFQLTSNCRSLSFIFFFFSVSMSTTLVEFLSGVNVNLISFPFLLTLAGSHSSCQPLPQQRAGGHFCHHHHHPALLPPLGLK